MKTWWNSLTKTEKSALATLSFIAILIFLFVCGTKIGQAIGQL